MFLKKQNYFLNGNIKRESILEINISSHSILYGESIWSGTIKTNGKSSLIWFSNSDDIINILDVLGIQDIILNKTAKTFDNVTKVNTSNGLAGDNYLSANKAFVKVQKSEQQLKVNFQKQKLMK